MRRLDQPLSRYRSAILALPASGTLEREHLLTDEFLLGTEGCLSVYYAPFEHLNLHARIAIVGLTPGWRQMRAAFATIRQALAGGATDTEALAAVKREAAFAGSMRTNLVTMLDGIGLRHALEIASCSRLFEEPSSGMLHACSALRYPVFRDGDNYAGNPPPSRSALLSDYVSLLADELASVADALVVPLGKAVEGALGELVAEGRLDGRRCLLGFPHPSGLNVHRLPQYQANRVDLRRRVQAWIP